MHAQCFSFLSAEVTSAGSYPARVSGTTPPRSHVGTRRCRVVLASPMKPIRRMGSSGLRLFAHSNSQTSARQREEPVFFEFFPQHHFCGSRACSGLAKVWMRTGWPQSNKPAIHFSTWIENKGGRIKTPNASTTNREGNLFVNANSPAPASP